LAKEPEQLHHGHVHLMLHPVMPLWLLAIIALGALALIVYLYQQQRDLAPKRTITVLSLMRIALLLLLAIALAGPALQWTHRQTSPGQLWLVLDHSKSMGVRDVQAGQLYALRWACALGRIPDYSDALDRAEAELSALTQQLRILNDQESHQTAVSRLQAQQQNRRSLAALQVWQGHLHSLINQLSRHTVASEVANDLRQISRTVRHITHRSGADISDTGPGTQAYAAVNVRLGDVMRALQPLARNADQTFLAAHQSDVTLQAQLHHVLQLHRAQLALEMLSTTNNNGKPALARLLRKDAVHLVSFAGTAYTASLPPYGDAKSILQGDLNSTGNSTNISQALLTTASNIERSRRADVLVVSDGRANVGSNPAEIARLLAVHHVHTFTLCIGSDQAPPGASIDSIHAPRWIYKHQYLRATAIIHLRSLADKPITVELLQHGSVIARRVIVTHRADAYKSAQFKNMPPGPGVYAYRIKVLPAATMSHAPVRTFRVTVRRDKLQVLLIDGQPGWNYQYLVNYFSRSRRVHLQAVLLHPASVTGIAPPPPVVASPENPSYLAQKLPVGRKAWEAFDVIILGDIPGNTLSPVAQQGIAYAVQIKGAALVLIAGQEFMPQDWSRQPLRKLFPIKFNAVWPPALLRQENDNGFLPALTAQGAQSGLSQLGVDQRTDSAIWRSMPRWYWHSAYTQARTDARVLWGIVSGNHADSGDTGTIAGFQAARRRALLTTMSIGSGRVMYLASNQLWRLRYVHGYNVEDVFLGQLLRWASGSQLPAGGKFVRFGTNHSSYNQGQNVIVQARILNDRLLPETALHFQTIATSIAPASRSAANSRGSSPGVYSAAMLPQSGVPGYYSGLITGLPPGRYRITLRGGGVHARLTGDPTASVRSLTIRVKSAGNLEMLDTTSDPALMQQIARAGDGIALPGPFASILAGYMPPVKQVIKIPETSSLFAHPHRASTFWLHVLFLLTFTGLLTAEWLLRKSAGMV